MDGIKRCILRNGIWIVVGSILTAVSVKSAYVERGYLAYGGEWLTLPLVLMVVRMVRNIGHAVKYLFGLGDWHGACGD